MFGQCYFFKNLIYKRQIYIKIHPYKTIQKVVTKIPKPQEVNHEHRAKSVKEVVVTHLRKKLIKSHRNNVTEAHIFDSSEFISLILPKQTSAFK